MFTVTKGQLNQVVGQKYKQPEHTKLLQKALVNERLASDSHLVKYDVFLSHCFLDRETVSQINYFIEEDLGLDTYVDWIEDPELDRENVTPATAEHVRGVMSRCSSLIYAVSRNSASSKWMPWELGYSDGLHGRVAVLVIDDEKATVQAYRNQEFVGIYPPIDMVPAKNSVRPVFWVNDPELPDTYERFTKWIKTGAVYTH